MALFQHAFRENAVWMSDWFLRVGFLVAGSKFHLLEQLYLSCLIIVPSSKIFKEWPCAM